MARISLIKPDNYVENCQCGVQNKRMCIKTIDKTVSCSGIGVHSGEETTVRLKPAAASSGIIFLRTDGEEPIKIAATYENVRSSINATTIGDNGAGVSTVEHLLAALSAMEIDAIEVEVDGPELPIMDGSAAPFVSLIRSAGTRELSGSRKWLVVEKPVKVNINGSRAEIRPSAVPSVNCSIAYNHPYLRYQARRVRICPVDFENEIASARTYGFLEDVNRLRSMGLAKGSSLENALVLDRKGVVNEEGMRFEDECVRHKILDLIGDLALAGMPVLGAVSCHKSGHSLSHKLITELMNNPHCYRIADEAEIGHGFPSASENYEQAPTWA